MITLGVYSSNKYNVDPVRTYKQITQCCTLWDNPSPINYVLSGTEAFTTSVDKWLQDSEYFCINVTGPDPGSKRKGSQKSSPRKLSPRLKHIVKMCSHVIIMVHDNDDEWMYLIKALDAKVIAIKG